MKHFRPSLVVVLFLVVISCKPETENISVKFGQSSTDAALPPAFLARSVYPGDIPGYALKDLAGRIIAISQNGAPQIRRLVNPIGYTVEVNP
jgi:hypothetical protein